MTSDSSAAPDLAEGLLAVAESLWGSDSSVLVTDGMPAFDPWNDVVCVASSSVNSEPAGASPRRPRDEFIAQEIILYCYRAGGREQQAVVRRRAYDMLGELEDYVRLTDPTVGGAVLQCFLTDHTGDSATDQSILANGRMFVLSATFTARNRIV